MIKLRPRIGISSCALVILAMITGCENEREAKLKRGVSFAKTSIEKIGREPAANASFQSTVEHGGGIQHYLKSCAMDPESLPAFTTDKPEGEWCVVLKEGPGPSDYTIEAYGEDVTKPVITDVVTMTFNKPPVVAELRMRVPSGCRAAPGAEVEPYSRSGWAREIVHEATGIILVYVPAGTFTMGSPVSENGRYDNEKQHQTTLSKGFYLGKYEVTQGQWEAVMGLNPAKYQSAGKDAPVERVLYSDCQSFCEKLGSGFRLPTEAEWEYACRAGKEGPYDGDLVDLGWYALNSDKTTHPVGQKKPNAWGLYDMHGNVSEWCQDGYDLYPDGLVSDPLAPASGASRVNRGGSWFHEAGFCRSAFRGRNGIHIISDSLGFRLLRVAAD